LQGKYKKIIKLVSAIFCGLLPESLIHESGGAQFCAFFVDNGLCSRFTTFSLESVWVAKTVLKLTKNIINDG